MLQFSSSKIISLRKIYQTNILSENEQGGGLKQNISRNYPKNQKI